MTRGRVHVRRDEHVKGANVIPGFRLEPKAGQALTKYARQHFCTDEDTPPRCDLAAAARYLLRTQLGWSPGNALDTDSLDEPTRGCRMELRLKTAIEKYQTKQGISGFLGTVRHLLRLGLGYDFAESMEIEQRFAAFAGARQELSGSFDET
jgi:hypothetical protein